MPGETKYRSRLSCQLRCTAGAIIHQSIAVPVTRGKLPAQTLLSLNAGTVDDDGGGGVLPGSSEEGESLWLKSLDPAVSSRAASRNVAGTAVAGSSLAAVGMPAAADDDDDDDAQNSATATGVAGPGSSGKAPAEELPDIASTTTAATTINSAAGSVEDGLVPPGDAVMRKRGRPKGSKSKEVQTTGAGGLEGALQQHLGVLEPVVGERGKGGVGGRLEAKLRQRRPGVVEPAAGRGAGRVSGRARGGERGTGEREGREGEGEGGGGEQHLGVIGPPAAAGGGGRGRRRGREGGGRGGEQHLSVIEPAAEAGGGRGGEAVASEVGTTLVAAEGKAKRRGRPRGSKHNAKTDGQPLEKSVRQVVGTGEGDGAPTTTAASAKAATGVAKTVAAVANSVVRTGGAFHQPTTPIPTVPPTPTPDASNKETPPFKEDYTPILGVMKYRRGDAAKVSLEQQLSFLGKSEVDAILMEASLSQGAGGGEVAVDRGDVAGVEAAAVGGELEGWEASLTQGVSGGAEALGEAGEVTGGGGDRGGLDDVAMTEEEALLVLLEAEAEGGEEYEELHELREGLEADWAEARAAAVAAAAAASVLNINPFHFLVTPQVAEKQPWRHASSLKDRLGLTNEELAILKLSPRSGLGGGDPIRVEQRLTGRSAGGPKTAVGYLLGELRMRPEEVKEALMRWPPLLTVTDAGPHAVSSWLQGGLGLSSDDVGKMVKRNPSIVCCSIVHNLRPKLRWLQKELGLSRPQSIRLLVRCPAIFSHSIDDNMVPKVEWLTETLGFTRDQAARAVYANPGVLLSSIEGSMMPKIRWLVDALQMDDEMVFDMIRRRVVFPTFFTLSSEENLAPKLQWLAAHASSDAVRHVLFRQPSLLGYSAQGNLAPKVQWLQDRLGMSEEDAWRFIGRSPGFLTLSVPDTLEPKLWWLRDKLDVSLQGAAKILTTYPSLFDLSIEASLEPKLWWVRDALGLDRPDAAAILRRCPQIFGSSLKDTLEPKLSWLTVRLKATKERMAKVVKKYPQILVYSIENNLAPTIDFYQYDMGQVQPSELLQGLEMKPSVLAASLEKRLLPRASKMRAAGIEPEFSRDFRAVAQLTDAQFRDTFGTGMDGKIESGNFRGRVAGGEATPPVATIKTASGFPQLNS
eukprot:jgi/Undpi1/8482/HiC_scaffold_25.g10949.m1